MHSSRMHSAAVPEGRLDQIPLNFPLGYGPGASPPEQASPPLDQPPSPWTEFLTHASKNITLPQTSFAGGKNSESIVF